MLKLTNSPSSGKEPGAILILRSQSLEINGSLWVPTDNKFAFSFLLYTCCSELHAMPTSAFLDCHPLKDALNATLKLTHIKKFCP